MNRQNPNRNQSAYTERRSSDLGRLPANDGPHGVTRTPPPRDPVEPPRQRPRPWSESETVAPPVPRPQAQAPAVVPAAPPSSAAASASSGALIPTSSAEGCRIGGVCRLAEPTFACTLAEAQNLAAAGPLQGRQAGLAEARAGRCEIVAARRPLLLEATKSPQVVYATENGKHVGYLPIGVFAPPGSGAVTTCVAPGFCALSAEAGAWGCPKADDLDLPTIEARRMAKCVQLSAGQVGEVATLPEHVGPIALRIGGNPPYLGSYYFARGDLAGIGVRPTPTPVERGWCRPGDWCVIDTPTFLCAEKSAYERILAAPVGEARRTVILATRGCRIVLRGNPLKPDGSPIPGDTNKLIEAAHPVFGTGWTSANTFKAVSFGTPVRYTSHLSDIVMLADRAPSYAAVSLTGPGTREAVGVFRSGSKERLVFCKANEGSENADPLQVCLNRPDATKTISANCEAKYLSIDGDRYGLAERPSDASPDIHGDPNRHWLFRNLATREWLDGSVFSGELMVGSAFDALCPGTNPDAALGIAYRDPNARYPRELIGRWFTDHRACTDPRREDPEYRAYLTIVITGEAQRWPESEDRINAIRRLGPGSWAIDAGFDSRQHTELFKSLFDYAMR